jgi:hypothetical protein
MMKHEAASFGYAAYRSTWQKLGQQVRCGETAITIFAPAPYKQTTTGTAKGEATSSTSHLHS